MLRVRIRPDGKWLHNLSEKEQRRAREWLADCEKILERELRLMIAAGARVINNHKEDSDDGWK